MRDVKNFLAELGTEELPPKALKLLISSFKDQVVAALDSSGLSYGEVKAYATPRRLALSIQDLASHSPDKTVEKRGPIRAAALNSAGEPTPAALGFAKTCGVSFSELTWTQTEKGEYLNYRGLEKGLEIKAILPGIIQKALESLPIPKTMRWGNSLFSFVRPVQWLVMLYGTDVIPADFLGVSSGRNSGSKFFPTGSTSSYSYPFWIRSWTMTVFGFISPHHYFIPFTSARISSAWASGFTFS